MAKLERIEVRSEKLPGRRELVVERYYDEAEIAARGGVIPIQDIMKVSRHDVSIVSRSGRLVILAGRDDSDTTAFVHGYMAAIQHELPPATKPKKAAAK